MSKIDIIICTYNNGEIISRCLDSVENQTFQNYMCFLVDDGSSDNTLDLVRKKYPWVTIIKKDRHTGPAASRNLAIRKTSSEFVTTLDSDVQLEKNWLEEQLKAMQDEAVGIAASNIFYSWNRRTINSRGGSMTRLGFGFDIKMEDKKGSTNNRVLYGHSAAMMARRHMIDEIGAFDETYFYGNEDTDMGWRANLAGWHVIFNPKAIAYHDENNTIRKMPRMVAFHGTKNRIRSLIKNYSTWNLIKYLPIHMILVLANAAVTENRTAKLKALIWNLMNFKMTYEERLKVQKIRKISDDELMELLSSGINIRKQNWSNYSS